MYLDPIRLVSVNQTQMTFEWSQPKFTGSCDVQGFALYMNDGSDNETLVEIDSTLIRNKPLYTTHTTNAPNKVGSKYVF
jgi:hypothetical protein